MTHTHFIGIGGTGLSAIARVLLERGQTVTGSDRELSPLAESLQKAGVKVFTGHAAENVRGADVVVRSSAVPEENVEVAAAKQAGIPVLKRVDFLGQLLEGYTTVAVAGSHGKTSTTAMVAWALTSLNRRPGFIVGGVVQNLNTNAHAGRGPLFVIEADEYDYMFWGLTPKIAVVTNIEHDHPDCFPTPESFYEAFQGFADRIVPGGTLVACMDDPGAARLLAYANEKNILTRSYSLHDASADYSAKNLVSQPGSGYRFEAWRGEDKLAEISLRVPGEHNAANALGALIVGDLLELDLQEAGEALGDYMGSGRRFDILGMASDVVVVDDYGHHPTEIKATLAAAKDRYPGKRLWAVWQPHTYSRTQQLLMEFGAAFGEADQVIVTKVYSAREEMPEDFNHQQIVDAIEQEDVRHVPGLEETAEVLLAEVRAGDVVIVFSAGDATEISAKLFAGLQQKEGQRA